MTKNEMTQLIGSNAGISNKDTEKVLDAFVAFAQDALKTGNKVSLTGLGTFTPKDRAARTARNPKTGEKVEVPAKKTVKFKPGKELLEIMQGAGQTKTQG
jgi:nucleoid DNA-binding protein